MNLAPLHRTCWQYPGEFVMLILVLFLVINLSAHFTRDFCSHSQHDGNFAMLKFSYWQQNFAHALLQNLNGSLYQNESEIKTKFPSNLNCDRKTVNETGPDPQNTGQVSHLLNDMWCIWSMITTEVLFSRIETAPWLYGAHCVRN